MYEVLGFVRVLSGSDLNSHLLFAQKNAGLGAERRRKREIPNPVRRLNR